MQALEPGTLDGTSLKEGLVLLFGELCPLRGTHLQELRTGSKLGDGGMLWGVEVRTGTEAAVATIEARCEVRFHKVRKVCFAAFYGVVADAPPGMEGLSVDGLCGTGFYAPPTGAARVMGEGEGTVVNVALGIRDDFSQKESGTDAGNDQLGVLAHKTDAALLCPVFLHYGCGVHKATALYLQELLELQKAALEHPVVVFSLCIPRQSGLCGTVAGMIGKGHADDGTCAGHKFRRGETKGSMLLKVVHGCMAMPRNPVGISLAHLWGHGMCGSHAAGQKAETLCVYL